MFFGILYVKSCKYLCGLDSGVFSSWQRPVSDNEPIPFWGDPPGLPIRFSIKDLR